MTDWGAIIESAAITLHGNPTRRAGKLLRFGRHGSLSVDCAQGRFYDFEHGVGGGPIRLVEHSLGVDRTRALEWLRSQGHLASTYPTESPSQRHTATPRGKVPDPHDNAQQSQKIAQAGHLWGCGTDPNDSPGRTYLVNRLVWPPTGSEINLPPSVRWLPIHSAGGIDGVPSSAAGCLMFRWGNPVQAVTLMAITADGQRQLWWNKTKCRAVGKRRGQTFETHQAQDTDTTWIVEGELDALALVWLMPGNAAIQACGGTSNITAAALNAGGLVDIHADGDAAGRKAAYEAVQALRLIGQPASVCEYADGCDPADALAERLNERIAIHEHDGLQSESDAFLDAWRDLIRSHNRSTE